MTDVDVPTRPLLEYRFASSELLDVRWKERLIDLIVIPYNDPAVVLDRRSNRMVTEQIDPGAFDGVERRANRVKVNRAHDVESVIGRALALHPGDQRGLRAELRISRTVAGDEALELAADGALDASAGFAPMPGGEQWDRDRKSRRITRAYLGHIALTGDPAYDNAQVLAVRTGAPPPATSAPATPNLDAIRLRRLAADAGMPLG
jgi:HK97 family phage prohead protease